MAHIKIEMNRYGTKDQPMWTVRSEGESSATLEEAIASLPSHCSQYQHRLFYNGMLVAEVLKPRYLNSKVIRHDAH